MRKIILLGIIAIAGYFLYKKVSNHQNVSNFFESNVAISDLKQKPSVFADSLVTLHNLTIQSTETILNYSKSVITDGSGEVLFLSNRPHKIGEMLDTVKGRFIVVFQMGDKSCEVFIDDDLKPMNDLIRIIVSSIVY